MSIRLEVAYQEILERLSALEMKVEWHIIPDGKG